MNEKSITALQPSGLSGIKGQLKVKKKCNQNCSMIWAISSVLGRPVMNANGPDEAYQP